MLAAAKGRIQGNTVLIDEDIRAYDGTEVIVTKPRRKAPCFSHGDIRRFTKII